jgi:CheY-like chemotaxis protein
VRRNFLSSVKAFLQAWRFLPLTAWRTTAGATRDDDGRSPPRSLLVNLFQARPTAMAQFRHDQVDAPMIVIVDEDASLRHSLRFSLAVEGFAVRTYATAGELLSAADLPERGCLVIDYNLPDMTGLELVARLRMRNVELPAILITTNPTGILRRRAEQAGVRMVEKPLLGDSLVNGIQAALIPAANHF